MPWRKYVADWMWPKTLTQASPLAYDEEQNSLLCRLDAPLEPDQSLTLELPCGNSVETQTLWQRQGSENGSLAAFCWRGVEGIAPPANTAAAPPLRREVRRPFRLWVSFAKSQRSGTVTRDLSLHGCSLAGDFREELGETLEFYLELPDGDSQLLRGRVAWADGSMAGLQFVNLGVIQEQKLIKNLKTTDLTPAAPLPDWISGRSESKYEVFIEEGMGLLRVTLENWEMEFILSDAGSYGAQQGMFTKAQVTDWSHELKELKSQLKLSLRQRQNLVHFRLLSPDNEILSEVWGREAGFHRRARGLAPAS